MVELLQRNRDFRLLFAAQVISYCGDWFATVALISLVTELGKGTRLTPALAASLVFVAQSLPMFLVSPFAGPLADRLDRRMIMIIASCLQAGSALLLLLPGRGTVWIAFAAQSIIAALAGFFGPASQAAVANLVTPEELPRAATLLGSTWGAMLAIGAALGGAFTVAFGRSASFVADAVSFLLAALLLSLIRGKTRSAGTVRARVHPIRDTRDALAFARTDRGLLFLLCSKGGFGLSSGVVGVLSSLAITRYKGGPGVLGVLLAARGIGVVLGPVVAGRLGSKRDVPDILRFCSLSSIVYGVSYIFVGSFAPVLVLGALGAFVAHLGGGTQWTLSTYGLQANTPDEFRGRIMSGDFALVSLSMSVSFIGAGFLDRRYGPTTAFNVLGVLSCLWGLLYLRATRSLRGSSESGDNGAPTPIDPVGATPAPHG